eukprot:gene1537-922_t
MPSMESLAGPIRLCLTPRTVPFRMMLTTAANRGGATLRLSSSFQAARYFVSPALILLASDRKLREGNSAAGKKYRLPSAASSLHNPRSYRSRLRKAMQTSAMQEEAMESQTLQAELHPSARRAGLRREGAASMAMDDDEAMPTPHRGDTGRRVPRSKRQRRLHHVKNHVGREVFEKCRYLSDAEWESVLLPEKHAFAKYMSDMLREHPTQTTEQQRRRYFETTMVDPRDLEPEKTVRDAYERIKLGLPVQLTNPKRQLGVTQAAYELSEASLFDPDKSQALEDYMTQIKQHFADYVRHRREGRSTEAERRRLANMTREFHEETQKHLGNLFKYAEERIRRIAHTERLQQLEFLEELKRQLRASKGKSSPQKEDPAARKELPSPNESSLPEAPTDTAAAAAEPDAARDNNSGGSAEALLSASNDAPAADDTDAPLFSGFDAKSYKKGKRKAVREASVKRFLHRALGVDPDVARTLWEELESQIRFMEFCEVFARLTTSRGFEHTAADEKLDDYTQRIRTLYSADAEAWGTLEVVQYLAAKESTAPVEWAKQWYERVLRIPLQHMPEYRRLEAIRREEVQALDHAQQHQTVATNHGSEGRGVEAGGVPQGGEGEAVGGPPIDGPREDPDSPSYSHRLAQGLEKSAARYQQDEALRLTEKMFLRPDDPRLKTLHERRLRYIAYVQMEEQIQHARENAKRFAGIENTAPEAARCRELYQALLARGRALKTGESNTSTSEEKQGLPGVADTPSDGAQRSDGATTAPAVVEGPLPANIFAEDPEAVRLFEEIRDLVLQVLQRYHHEARSSTPSRAEQRLAKMRKSMQQAEDLARASTAASDAMEAKLEEQKKVVTARLLRLAEKDIHDELRWIEAMDEAERPPLLPVPEEGMSYISAADVNAWKELREAQQAEKSSPFAAQKRRREKMRQGSPAGFHASFLGQPWEIPDKPTLFWGTGVKAVQQALEHAAEEAQYRRQRKELLPPPYPCAVNPWGWRLVKDILDD